MTDPSTPAGRALLADLRRGVTFVSAWDQNGKPMADYATPRILAIEAEARREAVLTPAEIHDLDMALRYALIDHDTSCRAIGMENTCTCPARGHFDRARATVKRVGAPYRKPSGDYDLDAVAGLNASEPRLCACGAPAEWPDGKCDKHHARRGLRDTSGPPPTDPRNFNTDQAAILAREASAEGSPHAESFRRADLNVKPDGWHTYHICDGLLREITQLDRGVLYCTACDTYGPVRPFHDPAPAASEPRSTDDE